MNMFSWFYKEDEIKKQRDATVLSHKTMLFDMEQETQKHLESQKKLLNNSQKVLSDASSHQLSNLLKEQKQAWNTNKQEMKDYIQKNNEICSGVRISYSYFNNMYPSSYPQYYCNNTIFLSSDDPSSLANLIYENPKEYLTKKLNIKCLDKITSIKIVIKNDSILLYKIAKYLNINTEKVNSLTELEILINNHITQTSSG